MADPQTLPLILRYSLTSGYTPPKAEFTLNTFVVNRADGLLFWLASDGNTVKSLDMTLATVAKLVSPSFTGNPQAPTAANSDSSTTIATTRFITNVALRFDIGQAIPAGNQQIAKKTLGLLGTGYAYLTGNPTTLVNGNIGGTYIVQSGATAKLPALSTVSDGASFIFQGWGGPAAYVAADAADGAAIAASAVASVATLTLRNAQMALFFKYGTQWIVWGMAAHQDDTPSASIGQGFNDTQLNTLLNNLQIVIPHGQCRLVADSGTQLSLQRLRGNKLFINGNYRTIPVGGVQVSNSGLSANTRYWVYAYWNGSAIVLITSLSTPVYDPTYGYKTANGNPAAVYIGTIMTTPSSQFQDTPAFRGVNTYYGKRPRAVRGASGTSSTSSQTSVELATSQRAYFLCDDETSGMFASIQGNAGSGNTAPGYSIYTQPSLDGADTAATALSGVPAYGDGTATTLDFFEPGEGWHYLAIKGQTVGNYSASFRGCVGGMVWM